MTVVDHCIVDTKVAKNGAIALLNPPRVRVRATVKLSAMFFHDESSITIGGTKVQQRLPKKYWNLF